MPGKIRSFGRFVDGEQSFARLFPPAAGPDPRGAHPVAPAGGGHAESGAMPADAFVPRRPRCRFENLVLADSVRVQIDSLLHRIRHHDLLYHEWGLARIDPHGRNKCINFFGPPGTGKTMCADALAAELGLPIIEVNYAEIESKYVGDTPKNIKRAFETAHRRNAVLFFDEADSILGKRMSNVTQAAEQAVNVTRAVMLKQLDGFDGVVVFATNLARNFDSAFVRRILLHVEVTLPDASLRQRLFERMIDPVVPGRDALDFQQLAHLSDGLAGGDIKNAVIIALSNCAARRPAERRVGGDDLVAAIRTVQAAKREVGCRDGAHKMD